MQGAYDYEGYSSHAYGSDGKGAAEMASAGVAPPEHAGMAEAAYGSPAADYRRQPAVESRWTPARQSGDPLNEFLDKWGLDSQAAEWLQGLEPHVRDTVIRDFAPRGAHLTPDAVVKMLYAFGRSVAGGGPAAPRLPQRRIQIIEEFAEYWRLDPVGLAWMYNQPAHIRDGIIKEFNPFEGPVGLMNPLTKLKAFARTLENRLPQAGYPAYSPPPAGGKGGSFVPRAGFQAAPAPSALQLTGNHEADVQAFMQRWNLEAPALEVLQSLPQEVQETAMRQFEPRSDQGNLTGKFLSFARSIERSRQAGIEAAMNAEMAGEEGAAEAEKVTQFVERWQLDEGNRNYIWTLPQEVRDVVIEQFAPAEGTPELDRKLRAFAKSILDRFSAGQLHHANGGPAHGEASIVKKPFGSSTASDQQPSDEEEAFLAHWGLAELSAARAALLSLPAGEQRSVVIRDFAPSPGTRDVLKLFIGFAHSVQRNYATVQATGLPVKGGKALGGDPAHLLRHAGKAGGPQAGGRPMPWRPAAAAGGGGAAGFRSASWTPATVAAQPNGQGRGAPNAPAFADYWQLDEGSRALLRGLDYDIQVAVIAEPSPSVKRRGGDALDDSGMKHSPPGQRLLSRSRTDVVKSCDYEYH
eukprot:TRINITY_DN10531_c0_g2_i5.p1 TRINITY_DN10531_c0_g2~~TRINITY_DN10531_c0_g2_i5.p1  ORF type:complete len:636 (-),score=123.16 TRINITY_DN10531_c0_g2_i5:119-2026(-)